MKRRTKQNEIMKCEIWISFGFIPVLPLFIYFELFSKCGRGKIDGNCSGSWRDERVESNVYLSISERRQRSNERRWLRTKLSVRIQFRRKFDFRFCLLSLARIHARPSSSCSSVGGVQEEWHFRLFSLFLAVFFFRSSNSCTFLSRSKEPVGSYALCRSRSSASFLVQIYGDFVWCFYWIYFWVNFSWT